MDASGKTDHPEDVHSTVVRAGKRTYFFDVKSTRSNELYLTITESKKRFNQQSGRFFYEKHKVFLYREDFEKFLEALNASFSAIDELQGEIIPPDEGHEAPRVKESEKETDAEAAADTDSGSTQEEATTGADEEADEENEESGQTDPEATDR